MDSFLTVKDSYQPFLVLNYEDEELLTVAAKQRPATTYLHHNNITTQQQHVTMNHCSYPQQQQHQHHQTYVTNPSQMTPQVNNNMVAQQRPIPPQRQHQITSMTTTATVITMNSQQQQQHHANQYLVAPPQMSFDNSSNLRGRSISCPEILHKQDSKPQPRSPCRSPQMTYTFEECTFNSEPWVWHDEQSQNKLVQVRNIYKKKERPYDKMMGMLSTLK